MFSSAFRLWDSKDARMDPAERWREFALHAGRNSERVMLTDPSSGG